MAGRTSDISTSSFKPLSLDEIMAVPLAKQAQEDSAQLSLDEFAALESQALGKDKEYVQGQIGAFKKEAGGLSDQLMSSGVDRNLINKTRSLRNKKTNELSLSGKTGQAAAAYNQQQANKKAIMSRKDLTADQKRAGLARAEENYTGVAEGGQYEDYVGTAHIDVMAKGREIMSKMKPQERARALGISYDESTGLYSNGANEWKELTAEQIRKVVYHGLKGDQNVAAYLKELDDLNIADPEKMLNDAADSAGNVGQIDVDKEKWQLLPEYLQGSGTGLVNTKDGNLDSNPNQNWSSRWDIGTAAAFNHTLDIPEDEEDYQDWFNQDDGMFTDQKQETSKWGIDIPQIEKPTDEAIQEAKDIIAQDDIDEAARSKANKGYLIPKVKRPEGQFKKRAEAEAVLIKNKIYAKRVPNQEAKNLVSKVRENNIAFSGMKPDTKDEDGNLVKGGAYTDKDVYKIYMQAKKKSAATASQLISPRNPKNTFIPTGKRLVGADDQGVAGIISQNIHLKLPTGEEGGYRKIMEELGYDNDAARFMADLKEGGSPAYSPGVPDMPGARVVTFLDSKKNEMVTMYAEPTIEEARAFQNVSEINNLIYSGDNFKRIQGASSGANQFVIAELHPQTKRYEGASITTQPSVILKKKDIPYIKYTPVPGRPGVYEGIIDTSGVDGYTSDNEGEIVFKTTLDAEIQRGTNAINRYNDGTRNAVTTGKEGTSYKQ